jgi:hypothetical protein
MKVIFLDFDGVLNVIPEGFDDFGGIFHSHFIDNLKYIIEQTDAKLVISSSWKFSGIDYLHEMWKFRNYPGEIIGITPIYKGNNHLLFKERLERGTEIKMYLNDNPQISSYVIFDDDDDMLTEQQDYFIQTLNNDDHEDSIDCGYGLTKICAEKAIQILNKNK